MKNKQKIKQLSRKRRHNRTRAKIYGTKERPRISVKRSQEHIYVQLIDDSRGHTLDSFNDLTLSNEQKMYKKKKVPKSKGVRIIVPPAKLRSSGLSRKMYLAREVGKSLGEKAKKNKIKKAVFDRGPYKFHGRIKALADGARSAGLEF